ncbi:serine/threonine protein kinase [Oscillatoria salina]|uniref:serine/threonine protein kinase n=1 Tax=Oscillatoria salina TaxID=331517 RepID=UPI0013B95256|nr:serine/threonine-protein kinase [Oscillatoria salina]MBZ8180713.1 protein kinase [Oscillatoria salina IIICB1]NET87579.1 protein kinase [Kamptonema sp. SIO1D9]
MENLHSPGKVVGERYRIVAPLGEGGFSTTYEAEDLTNYQRVAFKALSLRYLEDWKVLELFEREAKILANLNHPGIPKYIDYFHEDTESDRHFYLVQEIVSGTSLADLIASGWHATAAEVKDIATQVLEILDYLHRLNPPVIHRDIKPKNIIRQSDGKIFLVDFGAVQDVYRNTMTAGGTFVGTFGYMPPEQYRGQAYFSSDLYSLGATLIFLLTHRSPADLPQKRLKISFRQRVQIAPYFADWLEKMLEPTAEDRFQTAKEALKALNERPNNLSFISSLSLSRQKPAGSKIKLRKNSRFLVAEIPPSGFTLEVIGLTFFAVFWNAIILPFFLGAIFHGGSFFILFILPHVCIGLWLIGRILFAIAGKIRLEIDSQKFSLQWSIGSRPIYSFKGSTAAISKVEVDTQVSSKGRKTITCAIWEGIRQHKFGSMMKLVEKEWLVEEISSFLKSLR